MSKLKLSPPWNIYFSKLKALFGQDEQIHLTMDEKTYTISLFVDDNEKYAALLTLLPPYKIFGNVRVKINIVPADKGNSETDEIFKAAFKGNPVLKDYVHIDNKGWVADYAVFAKEVVQFFSDDLTDVNGNCNTLYQDIARDVFGDIDGLFYCTAEDDE